jgi:outer membrane lipoprotein-sorting protein
MSKIEENIAKLGQIDVMHSSSLDDRIIQDAMQVYERSYERRSTMNRTIRRLGFGGAVGALALLGMFLLFGGDASITQVAFADIIAPFLAAESATFTLTSISDDGSETVFNGFFHASAGYRLENDQETIIIDSSSQRMLTLQPARKLANFTDFGASAEQESEIAHFNLFEAIQSHLQQPIDDTAVSIEELGQKQINGVTSLGFRVTESDIEVTVWVNKETYLPTSIERHIPNETILMNNIALNPELNASLFSAIPPSGYSLNIQETPSSPGFLVMGTVRNSKTGQPIQGAKVSDDKYGPEPYRGAITNSEGQYAFTTWPEKHTIIASAPNFTHKRKNLSTAYIETGSACTLDFELEPE